MKVSEAVAEKAIRYIIEGRIRPESNRPAPIQSYLAFSESDDTRYRVVVGPSWTMDECPATVPCCHRVGAQLLYDLQRADPERYRLVVERILDRKLREEEPIEKEELFV